MGFPGELIPTQKFSWSNLVSLFAMFGLPGGTEMIILVVIVLVLFGSSQLPKLMFNIGRSKQALQKGLKEGLAEGEAEADSEVKDDESK